ncbi:MAG: NAD(P)H-dependent oxidoreductase [Clostridiales bacterium]|nr:NAD(P)H-dependent oxidoreductase [Clostridiales bacterium]
MKKTIKNLLRFGVTLGAALTLMASIAFAAGWTLQEAENTEGWKYELDDGQYYSASSETPAWQWLDGNGDGVAECYAFDQDGWMYQETTTPDGYDVNADGAWTVDVFVKTMTVTAGYGGTGLSDTEPEGETDILIAYFSHSGTTAAVARELSQLTGGNLFEIQTVDGYPSSYQATVDIARTELDENARPVLAAQVDNFEDYEVVLLGYPIWWHTTPMAIQTFLDSYDFTGKLILPFCTSAGSDIEESMPAVRGNAGGGTVGSGLTANSEDEEELRQWLADNGVME